LPALYFIACQGYISLLASPYFIACQGYISFLASLIFHCLPGLYFIACQPGGDQLWEIFTQKGNCSA
jgi:hypothetical protein